MSIPVVYQSEVADVASQLTATSWYGIQKEVKAGTSNLLASGATTCKRTCELPNTVLFR
jgi:hypothetical protein